MELEHSFTVPVPADQAWDVLLDVERVAKCLPGATLDSVEGDEVVGRIKVKLGPISMTYAGTARFTERNRDAGVVTLEAAGKETRGAGTASATIRSELHGKGAQTEVTVHPSLNVTGKPAQFGRGVMAEVSAKLIGVFATNLANMLATDNGSAPVATPEPVVPVSGPAASSQATTHADPPVDTDAARTPASTVATPVPAPSAESLNLVTIAGMPVLKRIAAPAGALVALLTAVLILRRLRRR